MNIKHSDSHHIFIIHTVLEKLIWGQPVQLRVQFSKIWCHVTEWLVLDVYRQCGGLIFKVWKSQQWFRQYPWIFQPLKMRSPCCLEMLGTYHPVAWQHITEELQPHVKCELHSFCVTFNFRHAVHRNFRFVSTSLRLHIYTTEYFNTCRYWIDRLIKTNITVDNFFCAFILQCSLHHRLYVNTRRPSEWQIGQDLEVIGHNLTEILTQHLYFQSAKQDSLNVTFSIDAVARWMLYQPCNVCLCTDHSIPNRSTSNNMCVVVTQ
jgi:hypothetical protein